MTSREAAFLRFSQTAGGLCLLGSSAMHKERTTDTGLNFSTILRTWGDSAHAQFHLLFCIRSITAF